MRKFNRNRNNFHNSSKSLWIDSNDKIVPQGFYVNLLPNEDRKVVVPELAECFCIVIQNKTDGEILVLHKDYRATEEDINELVKTHCPDIENNNKNYIVRAWGGIATEQGSEETIHLNKQHIENSIIGHVVDFKKIKSNGKSVLLEISILANKELYVKSSLDNLNTDPRHIAYAWTVFAIGYRNRNSLSANHADHFLLGLRNIGLKYPFIDAANKHIVMSARDFFSFKASSKLDEDEKARLNQGETDFSLEAIQFMQNTFNSCQEFSRRIVLEVTGNRVASKDIATAIGIMTHAITNTVWIYQINSLGTDIIDQLKKQLKEYLKASLQPLTMYQQINNLLSCSVLFSGCITQQINFDKFNVTSLTQILSESITPPVENQNNIEINLP